MNFAPLLSESLAACASLSLTPIAVPDAYASVSRAEKQGTLLLHNQFFRLGDWGELRTVLITAPKISIVNLFFFPEPEWDLPLYVMNFVVLGTRPIAAVLDALCLAPDSDRALDIAATWRVVRHRYGHLRQAEDMPDWYRDCRSGHDFFVRPADAAALSELAKAHGQLWRAFLAGIKEAEPLPEIRGAAHRERLKNYKNHHRDNSPGFGLLRRSFGGEWTEGYLKEILFI